MRLVLGGDGDHADHGGGVDGDPAALDAMMKPMMRMSRKNANCGRNAGKLAGAPLTKSIVSLRSCVVGSVLRHSGMDGMARPERDARRCARSGCSLLAASDQGDHSRSKTRDLLMLALRAIHQVRGIWPSLHGSVEIVSSLSRCVQLLRHLHQMTPPGAGE
jgi:hypothetical protein